MHGAVVILEVFKMDVPLIEGRSSVVGVEVNDVAISCLASVQVRPRRGFDFLQGVGQVVLWPPRCWDSIQSPFRNSQKPGCLWQWHTSSQRDVAVEEIGVNFN